MPLNVSEIRHLIFDLDDTLFDTFGQLVKPAFLEASAAMIAAGLNAPSVTDCMGAREKILLTNKRQKIFSKP